jgi:phosphoribosylformylglycinamidine cyclo-ligase
MLRKPAQAGWRSASQAAFAATRGIKALAHITGGGFLENIPRVLPPEMVAEIDLAKVPCPPVFAWLQRTANIAEPEVLRTFNCGIGMIAVCAPPDAAQIVRTLTDHGERVMTLDQIRDRTATEPQVAPRGHLAL